MKPRRCNSSSNPRLAPKIQVGVEVSRCASVMEVASPELHHKGFWDLYIKLPTGSGVRD